MHAVRYLPVDSMICIIPQATGHACGLTAPPQRATCMHAERRWQHPHKRQHPYKRQSHHGNHAQLHYTAYRVQPHMVQRGNCNQTVPQGRIVPSQPVVIPGSPFRRHCAKRSFRLTHKKPASQHALEAAKPVPAHWRFALTQSAGSAQPPTVGVGVGVGVVTTGAGGWGVTAGGDGSGVTGGGRTGGVMTGIATDCAGAGVVTAGGVGGASFVTEVTTGAAGGTGSENVPLSMMIS